MKLTINEFVHGLTEEQRDEVRDWAKQYIDINGCFEIDIGGDGPTIAARFYIYDFPAMRAQHERVWTTIDVMSVAPCPWPFAKKAAIA